MCNHDETPSDPSVHGPSPHVPWSAPRSTRSSISSGEASPGLPSSPSKPPLNYRSFSSHLSPWDRALESVSTDPALPSSPKAPLKHRNSFSSHLSPLDRALDSISTEPSLGGESGRLLRLGSPGLSSRSSSPHTSLSSQRAPSTPPMLMSTLSLTSAMILDVLASKSRPMSRQSSLALSPVDIPLTLDPTEDRLQHLVDLLASSPPHVTVNLGGNTLGGPLRGGGDARVLLATEGLVLRNGTLELPDGVSLTITAHHVTLEGVTILGTGASGCSVPVVKRGLLEVIGGRVTLQRCTLMSPSAPQCSTLLVCNGGAAQVSECDLRGAQRGSALLAQSLGTHVTVTASHVHSSQASCVMAMTGAVVELTRCEVEGSRERSAAEAVGAGTSIIARQSRLFDCNLSALQVYAGAFAELEGCELYGTRLGDNVEVEGRGTRLSARNCKVHHAANHGLYCGAGATASLSQCWVFGNTSSALTACDRGTHITATACILDGAVEPSHSACVTVHV